MAKRRSRDPYTVARVLLCVIPPEAKQLRQDITSVMESALYTAPEDRAQLFGRLTVALGYIDSSRLGAEWEFAASRILQDNVDWE